MALRIDPSRRLTWALAGLVVLLAAGWCWTLVRWQHAERQVQLAQQQLSQQEYARAVAEAQRALEARQLLETGKLLEAGKAQPIGIDPEDTNTLIGLPKSDGPGVPEHVDAGMLIDGAEMNSKRAIEKVEPLERMKIEMNGEIVPQEIDEGMILDGLERLP